MFTLPFTSTRLHFALPFGFLPSFLQAIALFVLLVGVAALFVGLYRVELRRVSRRSWARCRSMPEEHHDDCPRAR